MLNVYIFPPRSKNQNRAFENNGENSYLKCENKYTSDM